MTKSAATAFLTLTATSELSQRRFHALSEQVAAHSAGRKSRRRRHCRRPRWAKDTSAGFRRLTCAAGRRPSEPVSRDQKSTWTESPSQKGAAAVDRTSPTEQRRPNESENASRESVMFRIVSQGAFGVSVGVYRVARHAARMCVPLARSLWSQLSTVWHEPSSRVTASAEGQLENTLEIEREGNLQEPEQRKAGEGPPRPRPSALETILSQGPPRSSRSQAASNPDGNATSTFSSKRRRFLRAFGGIPEVVLYDLLTECEMRDRVAKAGPLKPTSALLEQRSSFVPYEVQRVIFDEVMTPGVDAPEASSKPKGDTSERQSAAPGSGKRNEIDAVETSTTENDVAVPVPAHVMDSLAAAMTSWERTGDVSKSGADPEAMVAESLERTQEQDISERRSAPYGSQKTATTKSNITTAEASPSGNILYVPISALGSLWHSISALSAGGRKRREEAQRIRTYTNAADAMAREDASFAVLSGADSGSSMASAFATASAIMASAPTSAPAKRNRGDRDGAAAETAEKRASTERNADTLSKPPNGSNVKPQTQFAPVDGARLVDGNLPRQTKITPAASPKKKDSRGSTESKTSTTATESFTQAGRAVEKTRNWWSVPLPFGWFRPKQGADSGRDEPVESDDYGIESIQRLLLSRHYGAGSGNVHADAEAFDALVERVQQLTLRAAAEAAMAIRTRKQAIAFIEEVGLSPLLNALSLSFTGRPLSVSIEDRPAHSNESRDQRKGSPGFGPRETAFTVSLAAGALANLANIMPQGKLEILRHPSLVGDLLRILEAPVVGEAWEMQAKWSASMLIGALAMDAPMIDRAMFYRNRRLVRVLESMAQGTRVGYPEDVARASRRALACLGVHHWRPRVRGQRGLRILALDGGGTRALMSFEILKHITKLTGCPLHEMFDIICGTSTGAIIAGSLGIRRRPVEEVETLYRELIGKIFAKKLSSAPKMLLTRAYYDTDLFESILKREAGSLRLIDSSMDRDMNYVFFVSSVMNRRPHQLHLFRNYCYAPGQESRYPGTVDATLWQGMRASSAAPTFFSEIVLNGLIHADGALVANNPAGVAAHEARRLFPNVPIELLVSVGTGVAEKSRTPAPTNWADGAPAAETAIGDGGLASESDAANALTEAAASAAVSSDGSGNAAAASSRMSWNDVINSIVDSAVGTESVHHILEDVLPPSVYFRYNPEIAVMSIDEVRPGKLQEMVRCAQEYIVANSTRFEELAARLRPKMPQNVLERIRFEMQEEASLIFDLDDARDGPVPAL